MMASGYRDSCGWHRTVANFFGWELEIYENIASSAYVASFYFHAEYSAYFDQNLESYLCSPSHR